MKNKNYAEVRPSRPWPSPPPDYTLRPVERIRIQKIRSEKFLDFIVKYLMGGWIIDVAQRQDSAVRKWGIGLCILVWFPTVWALSLPLAAALVVISGILLVYDGVL